MRSTDIRAIHATARRIGLDEETRRALYRRVTGLESLTAMTDAQVRAAAEEIRRLAPIKPAPRETARMRQTSPKAHVRMVYVLWWRLAEAGIVAQKAKTSAERRGALNAFVNARFKTELGGLTTDVDFLSARLAVKVVEGLKAMAARAGLTFEAPKRKP